MTCDQSNCTRFFHFRPFPPFLLSLLFSLSLTILSLTSWALSACQMSSSLSPTWAQHLREQWVPGKGARLPSHAVCHQFSPSGSIPQHAWLSRGEAQLPQSVFLDTGTHCSHGIPQWQWVVITPSLPPDGLLSLISVMIWQPIRGHVIFMNKNQAGWLSKVFGEGKQTLCLIPTCIQIQSLVVRRLMVFTA